MSTFACNKDDCYDNAYEVFLRCSNLHQVTESAIEQHLPAALKQLQMNDNRELHVLSIGAGCGDMDCKILQMLLKNTSVSKMTNTAVEPHDQSAQQYQYKLEHDENCKDLVSKVDFQIINKSFDEYTMHCGQDDTNKFDVIQAIHSFYFVDDVEKSMRYCYESMLKEQGVMILTAKREDVSVFTQIYTALTKYRQPGYDPLKNLGTKGFVKILDKCGYEFAVHSCPYTIDVTKIFNGNKEEKEANLLLDFFSFESDFRHTFDKKIVDEVLETLKKNAKEDKQGRMIVETPDELIVIYKNTAN